MGHMRKYKCPRCLYTDHVIRYGYRKKALRLLCKVCSCTFSFNPCILNTKVILSDHLDGFSFRTLARKYSISPMTAWRICEDELKKLPDNNEFTFKHCDRFSQILVCDGKYFNVVNGKSNPDWVLLWGFDYFRQIC